MTNLEKRNSNNSVYIIAEMSGNHGGDLSRAIDIVHAASKAGADCLKIQTYTPDTITINCRSDYFLVKGGLWDKKIYTTSTARLILLGNGPHQLKKSVRILALTFFLRHLIFPLWTFWKKLALTFTK